MIVPKCPTAWVMMSLVWKSNGKARNITQHVLVKGQFLRLIPLSCSCTTISQTTSNWWGLKLTIACIATGEWNWIKQSPSSDKQLKRTLTWCSSSKSFTTSSIPSYRLSYWGGGRTVMIAYSSWRQGRLPLMMILPRVGRAQSSISRPLGTNGARLTTKLVMLIHYCVAWSSNNFDQEVLESMM